jgi:hypothetical protein
MACMRTTVEITDEQHRALSAIAQRRGVRGFSVLVQEALDGYLANLTTDEVELLLALEGVVTESDAREMRSRIKDARSKWRTS